MRDGVLCSDIVEVPSSAATLLLGTPTVAGPWHAPAWCGGILAAGVLACVALFRRRTARPMSTTVPS